eukprot:gene19124-24960_t
MRVRKALRQRLGYPQGSTKPSRLDRKLWNITVVHTQPTGFSRSQSIETSCDFDNNIAPSSWRKCDGSMGNACFLTDTEIDK